MMHRVPPLRPTSPALVALLFAGAACSRGATDASSPATAQVAPSAQPAAPKLAPNTLDDKEYDSSVRPVYPTKNVVADPLATRLCEALHTLPRERHAACCRQQPGVVLTSECVRNLSGALAAKAVRLDAGEVEACEAAMRTAYQGCDWVGPWAPALPPACAGLVRGALEAGARCRSSLECRDDLRCLGAGPTDAGVCAPPQDAGRRCGTAVDTLAVYTRQDDFELRHPACKGYCERSRCMEALALGAECTTNAECGRARRCARGRCAAGAKAAAGEACLGGDCADGLRCVANRCAAPRPLGAVCSSDVECGAACELPEGASSGRCARRCSELPVLRKKFVPPAPAATR